MLCRLWACLGEMSLQQAVGKPSATSPGLSVPELGPGTDVEADVRAVGGPAGPTRYADVVVTHPVQTRAGRVSGSGPGAACNSR